MFKPKKTRKNEKEMQQNGWKWSLLLSELPMKSRHLPSQGFQQFPDFQGIALHALEPIEGIAYGLSIQLPGRLQQRFQHPQQLPQLHSVAAHALQAVQRSNSLSRQPLLRGEILQQRCQGPQQTTDFTKVAGEILKAIQHITHRLSREALGSSEAFGDRCQNIHQTKDLRICFAGA